MLKFEMKADFYIELMGLLSKWGANSSKRAGIHANPDTT